MHQALWIVSVIDEGKGTAIGESCGGIQWTWCLEEFEQSFNPTSKARGLALSEAATTWPSFSMNSALQPQPLKLEEVKEVFDETVN